MAKDQKQDSSSKHVVRNITRNAVLHEHPRFAITSLSQAGGLMFAKPNADDCLIFIFRPPRAVRFHMWFVFGPIDIIALDAAGKVIAQKERFAPWTFWSPNVRGSTVIELPVGTIAKTKTVVGDRIAVPAPKV